MRSYQLPANLQKFVGEIATSGIIATATGKAAIAQAICDCIDVPSSKVKNLRDFYRYNPGITVSHLASELNELFVIDTRVVENYAYMFYSLRYSATYPPTMMMITSKEDAILQALRVTDSFGEELSPVAFSADPGGYSFVYNGCRELVTFIGKATNEQGMA